MGEGKEGGKTVFSTRESLIFHPIAVGRAMGSVLFLPAIACFTHLVTAQAPGVASYGEERIINKCYKTSATVTCQLNTLR